MTAHHPTTTLRRRSTRGLGFMTAVLATTATAMVGLAYAPGEVAASTRSTVIGVPASSAIRFATLRFDSSRTTPPRLTAGRDAALGLPADVTFLTGVRRSTATGRWVGLLTMIRWETGATPAGGPTQRIRVGSDVPFTVVQNARATGARQATNAWAGDYRTRVGRQAAGALGDNWGDGAGLLRQVGTTIAGAGDPGFFQEADGGVPLNKVLVEVLPGGDGTGSIGDTNGMNCVITRGAITGTCRKYYNVGVPIQMRWNAAGDSIFEGWTYACQAFRDVNPCDLGRPAGGTKIRLGGLFFKVV